ncbi:MAG: hypothetical protein PHG82_03960 [Candidatus Gracilibacteria bacterium]|nr:hypothetical protein [Candidatus Gracilibacteria bacterium]
MNKAPEKVKEIKEIKKSAEYIEVEGIIKNSPDFYNGKISELGLKALYKLIDCGNYQQSTRYREQIENFCIREMDPNLCFDINIDYEKKIIYFSSDIEQSFVHNIKRSLINNTSENDNHLLKRKLHNADFNLETFQDIFKVKDYNEIYNYFLEISEGEEYFKDYKNNDNLDEKTLLKLIIGAIFLILFGPSIINIKEDNSVNLKLQGGEKEVKIGLDPRVKINIIGGEDIRYNGYSLEELEQIFEACNNIELADESPKKVANDVADQVEATISGNKDPIKEKKERREIILKKYFTNILHQIMSSDEKKLKKEQQETVLNAVKCFGNINDIHSDLKQMGFNAFVENKVKEELDKKMSEIFKEQTIKGVAGLVLRNNFVFANETIKELILCNFKANKEIIPSLISPIQTKKDIIKTDFKFLLEYQSNLSPNDVESGLEKPYLLVSEVIYTLAFQSRGTKETVYIEGKKLIKIYQIELYFKAINIVLESVGEEYKKLLIDDLLAMLMTSPKKRR